MELSFEGEPFKIFSRRKPIKIMSSSRVQHQNEAPFKGWSVAIYLKAAGEGFTILADEFRDVAKKLLVRLRWNGHKLKDRHSSETSLQSRTSSLTTTPVSASDSAAVDEAHNQNRSISLRYGFEILACLCSAAFMIVPAHLIDTRLGSIPTRRFAAAVYFQTCASTVFGFVAIRFLSPILRELPLRSTQARKIFNMTVYSSELGYHIFGLLSTVWLVYKRQFIYNFLVYRCSSITLPAGYQRHQMVTLFLIFFLSVAISEPLFVTMSLWNDIRQPVLFPELSTAAFYLVKCPLCSLAGLGTLVNSSGCMMIPFITTYLVVTTAAYLRLTFKKQLGRFKRPTKPDGRPLGVSEPSQQLEDIVDGKARDIIREFACDTLTMDWPTLTAGHNDRPPAGPPPCQVVVSPSSFLNQASQASLIGLKTSTTLKRDSRNGYNSSSQEELFSRLNQLAGDKQKSNKADSTLFLYKNLLKNLCELKGFISSYERRFGGFHLVTLSVDGFNVAQWITASLYESRQKGPMVVVWGGLVVTPFNVRVFFRVLTFVLSNLYIFFKCNSLSNQLTKLRCQLLRINVDLARANMTPIGGGGGCGAASDGVTTTHRDGGRLSIVDQLQLSSGSLSAAELEQIWLLFDQIERLSRYSHFRLTTSTYYGKRCLLLILGQLVSLVLLSIQLVDMYAQI